MKILIVEDDANIVSFLTRGFCEDGYVVDSASDGEEGEYLATMGSYDVVVLDWMLPLKSGIEVLKSLRAKDVTTPIIMLSAKGEVQDKVSCLNFGADDYLSKPFSFDELQARVESLYRRNISHGIDTIHILNIVINLNTKSVFSNDEEIELSAKEYELLMFFVKHKNNIVSKSMIDEQLWSHQEFTNSNVIEVTIYHLRQKIGKDFIKSYRNLGYKIEVK